jgi:hypothetical protein
VEIRLHVDDEFIGGLQKIVELKATDIMREALTIYNWAVQERLKRRIILSADEDGTNVARLTMPSLELLPVKRYEQRR